MRSNPVPDPVFVPWFAAVADSLTKTEAVWIASVADSLAKTERGSASSEGMARNNRLPHQIIIQVFPFWIHRLVIGRAMEERAISMVVAVVEANKKCGGERIAFQKKASDDLDVVRILLRLAKDLRFVSVGQYSAGVDKINEIGRMLNAWMESPKRV